MMGSSKHHLKHLLNEDQEPFVLKNYINEKRLKLNKPVLRTQIQLQTQNPISQNSSFFCKNVCFLSFQDSQSALTKSPLFEFSSKSKSPCRRNSNTLFVHIPAKTAALLLEAASRIENQAEKAKTSKNLGFGFIGSILKRLRRRKKSEIKRGGEIKVSVKDILRREPSDVCGIVTEEREEELEIDLGFEEKRVSDVGLSCSCNSRVSSAWTESNEDKSLELETSTSRSEASEEETEFVVQEQSQNVEFDSFRFILQNGSSPLCRSPELVSPATSPNRRKNQIAKKNEEGHITSDGKQQEKEEHCSPVSVLDLQIDEDEYEDEQEEEDDSELERSFAFVQKTKQKLMQKLRRFERLAELDPLELDKILAEDEDEDEDEDDEEDDKGNDDSVLQDNENCDVLVREVHRRPSCSNHRRVPLDMKRLIIDLLDKEGSRAEASGRDLVADKHYKRFSSLKGIERKTVTMMVEMEQKEWQKNSEHVEETVVAVELAVFDFLVEEFSVELVDSNDRRKF